MGTIGESLKAFIILLISIIIVIGVIVGGLVIDYYGLPHFKFEILSELKEKYNEKFIIKEEIKINEEKDKVYVVSPVNNKNLKFYVVDEYSKPTWLYSSTKGKYELYDTYTNSLILQDIENIKKIYPKIEIEKPKAYTKYCVSNLISTSQMTEITLDINNYNYKDVDEISNKSYEVYNYLKNNLSKYKAITTGVSLKIFDYTINVNTINVMNRKNSYTLDEIKYEVTKKVLNDYRETGNNKIFNIPAEIKAKYPVYGIYRR